MNFRPAIQIKTAIRAMQEVVMPALDNTNKQATEQAGLVVAMLELLQRTLPLSYRYDRDELRRNVALAEDLGRIAKEDAALNPLVGRVASTAANSRVILDRSLTDPAELESACSAIRAEIADFVTASYRDAPPTLRRAIARTTLKANHEQLIRERAWTISQGWESEPEKLQPIEAMI